MRRSLKRPSDCLKGALTPWLPAEVLHCLPAHFACAQHLSQLSCCCRALCAACGGADLWVYSKVDLSMSAYAQVVALRHQLAEVADLVLRPSHAACLAELPRDASIHWHLQVHSQDALQTRYVSSHPMFGAASLRVQFHANMESMHFGSVSAEGIHADGVSGFLRVERFSPHATFESFSRAPASFPCFTPHLHHMEQCWVSCAPDCSLVFVSLRLRSRQGEGQTTHVQACPSAVRRGCSLTCAVCHRRQDLRQLVGTMHYLFSLDLPRAPRPGNLRAVSLGSRRWLHVLLASQQQASACRRGPFSLFRALARSEHLLPSGACRSSWARAAAASARLAISPAVCRRRVRSEFHSQAHCF